MRSELYIQKPLTNQKRLIHLNIIFEPQAIPVLEPYKIEIETGTFKIIRVDYFTYVLTQISKSDLDEEKNLQLAPTNPKNNFLNIVFDPDAISLMTQYKTQIQSGIYRIIRLDCFTYVITEVLDAKSLITAPRNKRDWKFV